MTAVRMLAGFWLTIVAAASAIAQTSFTFYQPVQPPRAVQIVANDGMCMLAPANSVEAVTQCAADYIEWAAIDVQVVQGGRHVVISAEQAAESPGGTPRRLSDLALERVREIDIGADFAPRFRGTFPATLSEVLAAAKDRVNLLLKCHDVSVASLIKEIRDAQMQQQVLVAGSLELRSDVERVAGATIATVSTYDPQYSLEVLFASQSPAVIALNAGDVTPEICRTLHSLGLKVLVNVRGEESESVETWTRVMAAGVDLILTNAPVRVRFCQVRQQIPGFPVQFACHRGASRYLPENTLPAIRGASVIDADYIEVDIRTTQDGAFVLMHDGLLDRTTSGTGKVSEHTAAAIVALDAGAWFGRPFAGLRVPTLDEGLAAFGDNSHAYLDAKDIAPEALLAAIHRHDLMERHVVYQSVDFCRRLQALDPNVRLLPPLREAEELDAVAGLHPYGVDARWSILSKDLIDRCHDRGIKVFSDALGEHEAVDDYRQAMRWGIDVIQTDHPLRVLRAIELESAN